MPRADRSWFSIRARAPGTVEIAIYDEIGAWGIRAVDFMRELRALGGVAHTPLHTNPIGGEVFDGLAVYNLLKQHSATVEVRVDGLAASMASIVAMAGDRVVMPANAFLMIHDPVGGSVGSAEELRALADMLDDVRKSMAGVYRGKTGIEIDELLEIMRAETWLPAPEALARGFADEVLEPVQLAASLDLSRYPSAPSAVVAALSTAPATHDSEDDMTKASKPEGAKRAKRAKGAEDDERRAADDELEGAEDEELEGAEDDEELEGAEDDEELEGAEDDEETPSGRKRAAAIASLCAKHKVPQLAAKLIEEGVSFKAARRRIGAAGKIRSAVASARKINARVPDKAEEYIAAGLSLEAVRGQLFEQLAALQNPTAIRSSVMPGDRGTAGGSGWPAIIAKQFGRTAADQRTKH